MRPRLRALFFVLLAVGLTAPATGATSAPTFTYDKRATVVRVDDGDTFAAIVDGEGQRKIRMTGLNAMELDDYVVKSGDCHAREAWQRLSDLIMGKRVRLTAMDKASQGLGRDKRHVAVFVDGAWRDVGAQLLGMGHALWFPGADEWARNQQYHLKTQGARSAQRGIWNPVRDDGSAGPCDPIGPSRDARIDMWVQWDADGNDGQNVNGEWVRIKNLDPVRGLPIGGWRVRDSSLLNHATGENNAYTFPLGASIPAGRSITLHVGRGTNVKSKRYYWRNDKPKFGNVDYPIGMGDGAYMLDPDGHIRASFMYPCLPRATCTDPLRRKVIITKVVYNPDGNESTRPNDEYVVLRNRSDKRVKLEKYLLESYPYSYAFGPADNLRPGQVMRLHMGRGRSFTDSRGRLVRYWDHRSAILGNTRDWVRIRSFSDVQIHCRQWGGATCGKPV